MAQHEAATEQYLTFQVGGEEYGVGILGVREIMEYAGATRVPHAPAAVRGVINIRGSVVPVVDLALKFGLPASVATKRSCVVILEVNLGGEALVMGVLADAVSQVIDLAADDIAPPPAFGSRVRVEFLQGMARTDRGLILLLDMDRLLSVQEAAVASQPAEV